MVFQSLASDRVPLVNNWIVMKGRRKCSKDLGKTVPHHEANSTELLNH